MNYYELLLLNQNEGLRRIKRVFMIIALFHFVTGLAFVIVAACIWWRFVFAPAVWFCLGFVYGNIGYLFVTDYKYVYDNGTLSIYRHRRFGKYRLVVQVACADIVWDQSFGKQVRCTNRPANLSLPVGENVYLITTDDYLHYLIKGDNHVS